MRLKRIYEYLGDASTALNDRATARCPTCCPPDDTIQTIAQAVGTSIEIAGVTSVTYLDTVAMDSHRYVVAAVAGGSADNKGVWLVVVEAGADGVVTQFETLQRLDSAVGLTPISVTVMRFTSTQFVVFFQDSTPAPDVVYGLLCTLNADSTVTLVGARQSVDTNCYGGNVILRSAPIDSTRVTLARETNTADGNGYRPVQQVVITLTGSTLSAGTFVPISDYNSQVFNLAVTDTAGNYAMVAISRDGGATPAYRLLRSSISGTVVTDGDESDSSGLYTGATDAALVQLPGDTNSFFMAAPGLSGSAVSIVKMNAGLGTLDYTTGTTRTISGGSSVGGCDLATAISAGGTTYLACAYVVNDGTVPTEYTGELELFSWNGLALSSVGVMIFDTPVASSYSANRALAVSKIGLSDTRFPVAFVSSADAGSRKIRTFTFEFGNR